MIFVDASAWIAYELPDDRKHEAAVAAMRLARRGQFGSLVTSDYVLSESLTTVRMDGGMEAADRLATRVWESERVRFLWTSPESYRAAWQRMRAYRDKAWSLTDCISFVHMADLGIRKAHAFDRNFREAGFETVPE